MSLTSYRAAPPRVDFERPQRKRPDVFVLPVLGSFASCGSAGAARALVDFDRL